SAPSIAQGYDDAAASSRATPTHANAVAKRLRANRGKYEQLAGADTAGTRRRGLVDVIRPRLMG
ncbi:hypothetical protein, partial [Halorubrum sp. Ea1]|uniref:hypothetical protein n=1 Tax=Halorubrum sp. Ea1 TaxID=1480718 RepID=UPI001C3E1D6C